MRAHARWLFSLFRPPHFSRCRNPASFTPRHDAEKLSLNRERYGARVRIRASVRHVSVNRLYRNFRTRRGRGGGGGGQNNSTSSEELVSAHSGRSSAQAERKCRCAIDPERRPSCTTFLLDRITFVLCKKSHLPKYPLRPSCCRSA